jgi:shikimate kinase
LDDEIERRQGCSIADLFERAGEAGFRAVEARVLADLTEQASREPLVLATGGGAVTREDNRALLRHRWFTVYLHATVSTLVRRLEQDHTARPLLQGYSSLAERVASLLEQRRGWYEAVARVQIDVSDRSVDDVVTEIERVWAAWSRNSRTQRPLEE